MKKVERSEILSIDEYEKVRPEWVKEVIAARQARRVVVGDKVSMAFENHVTVRYQIQEMIRVEKIHSEAAVQHEIDVYNELIPEGDELSATLFIEIDDERKLKEMLPKLVGLEDATHLKIGAGLIVRGEGEKGRSREDYTSSVHYLRFPVSPEAKQALQAGASTVWLEIDHPGYGASARLSPETVQALAQDLSE